MHLQSLDEMIADSHQTDSLQSRVAANLRKARLRAGLSQEEFAERCGYHRTYIGSIERGERNITLNTLSNIASTLGISPIDLLK